MNIQKIKKAPQRIDVSYLSTLGIKAYGANNLYPQQAKAILDSSSTGAECCDRYARFIEGEGIANAIIYDLEVNHYGETTDDILTAVAQDLANYGGFALHVNYDLNCKICEVQHVPFESCRLQEDDDSGYIAHIVTHPDWYGKTSRNGKIVRVSKDTISTFDRFNPNPDIVRAHYPLPRYDRALTELSTDEGLSNVKFRNVRCNFLPSAFVISKTSQALSEEDEVKKAVEARGFAEDLAQFQGDETSNVLISLTVANDEEKPEIVPFPVQNFDKSFEVTDNSVVERIYCAFEQEPFLCIRSGKLGFSGTTIHDCYTYYSSLVSKEQRMIERAFSKVFDNWHEPLANLDCEIQPLTYNIEV